MKIDLIWFLCNFSRILILWNGIIGGSWHVTLLKLNVIYIAFLICSGYIFTLSWKLRFDVVIVMKCKDSVYYLLNISRKVANLIRNMQIIICKLILSALSTLLRLTSFWPMPLYSSPDLDVYPEVSVLHHFI